MSTVSFFVSVNITPHAFTVMTDKASKHSTAVMIID